MPEPVPARWICSQLGSREHYSVARALHRSRRLRMFLTDFWARPGDPRPGIVPGTMGAKIRERFHAELADAEVEHLGWSRIVFDLIARMRGARAWEAIMGRDRWFQQRLLARRRVQAAMRATRGPRVFFSYSYAAGALMRQFKNHGWKLVLGQIDPGELEQQIVGKEHDRYPQSGSTWQPAPSAYWQNWREECLLADRIVVNSHWSAQALARQGIDEARIRIIPLAYAPAGTSSTHERSYPDTFDNTRPLRVLFLGQINLRKGAHLALEAARMLRDRPVEWHFVGPSELQRPADAPRNVVWRGPVSRETCHQCYAQADVFLLPTLSDGFAMTQLEAQAAGLPVLASRYCGDVVRDGINGLLIDPLNAETIASCVERCLADASLPARLAANSRVEERFSMRALEANLLELESELFNTEPRPAGEPNNRSCTP